MHATQRIADLRLAILIGLALYNVYNVTSLVLLPDVIELSLVLRLGLVTPVSLGLVWVIGRTSPVWTERLVLFGVLNAYVFPVLLFWMTQAPLGLYTFGEFSLTIIFANMLLALRFPHSVAFTACALAATLLALATKADLQPSLRFAFAVQIATACTFSVYANYRVERRRCEEYLLTLSATLLASNADAARRAFQDLSQTDALTGLPNRRHLMDRLETESSRRGTIVLMMIDVDHFKSYNDTLGHPAGDDCLQRVGAILAAIARDHDAFCARFGGEEFTFILRDASEMEAARCARNLVQAVAASGITHPARADDVLTVSIGVAGPCNGCTTRPAQMIAAADRALYLAKRRGRNRFVMDEGSADLAQANG